MLKKLGLLGLMVASIAMFGCGGASKEIEATTEEAAMDPEVEKNMALESMSRMPPAQQAEMKKQMEAQKKQ